jgi:hypothetical protein
LGRPLGVQLREHKYNLKDGYLEKLKLAVYAFEEGHKIDWTHAPILQLELLLGNRKKRFKVLFDLSIVTIYKFLLDVADISHLKPFKKICILLLKLEYCVAVYAVT